MPPRIPLPKWPTLYLERELDGTVCGVDEAGYAPLAGPIVAAAVALPKKSKPRQLRGLTDSKLLSAADRERFFDVIHRIANVGVGIATVEEIDRLNIFHADLLAMRRAVEALDSTPNVALVDGRGAPNLVCNVKTVVKGDRRSLSIAAASVVAKVTRDRMMRALAHDWPGYGWESNAGYGTDEHYLGLLRHGANEHHRQSFAPINTLFGRNNAFLSTYRFGPIDGQPDFVRLELLELRRDLHAVFDGKGNHVGQVKNLRGRWTFHATGYDNEQQPRHGAGPCARLHGTRLAAPKHSVLRPLFSENFG